MKTKKEQFYIVRCNSAGVFFCNIEKRDGQNFLLTNVRRIWYWSGAASLSELAQRGTSDPDGCKFPRVVDEIEVFEVIEVLKCTKDSIKSISGVKVWTE